MNASMSQPSRDRLAADQRANEPSMEEILASIRRIIADGDTDLSPSPAITEARKRERQTPQPIPDVMRIEDIIGRKDETVVNMPLPPRSAAVEPPLLRPTQEASIPTFTPASAQENPPEQQLLSSESQMSVSAAFSALAAAKVVQDSANIDLLVREMLRPMLKSWLDDNLPTLVEKLVRAEIERVARGGK